MHVKNSHKITLFVALCILGLFRSTVFCHSCLYPEITFDTISPGVVKKISCFNTGGFGSCFDTAVYVESELLSELHNNFATKKYAIKGKFTSVTRKLRLDTTFFDTSIIIPEGGKMFDVNNYMDEKVTLEVTEVLKGDFKNQNLVFPHTWFYNGESTLVAKWDTLLDSTSYQPAQGSHFLALFDKYDSISHLGFAPTVDCFFVVSGYFIEGERIRKKGVLGAHGISVSVEDFMKGLSIKSQYFTYRDFKFLKFQLFTTMNPMFFQNKTLYNIMGRRRFSIYDSKGRDVFGPGTYIIKQGTDRN